MSVQLHFRPILGIGQPLGAMRTFYRLSSGWHEAPYTAVSDIAHQLRDQSVDNKKVLLGRGLFTQSFDPPFCFFIITAATKCSNDLQP